MSISPPSGQHASPYPVLGSGSIQCLGRIPGHDWSGNRARTSTRPYVCENEPSVSTQHETNGYSASDVRLVPGSWKKSSGEVFGRRRVRMARAPPDTTHSRGSYHCCAPHPPRVRSSNPRPDELPRGVHLVRSKRSPSNSSCHVSSHPGRRASAGGSTRMARSVPIANEAPSRRRRAVGSRRASSSASERIAWRFPPTFAALSRARCAPSPSPSPRSPRGGFIRDGGAGVGTGPDLSSEPPPAASPSLARPDR